MCLYNKKSAFTLIELLVSIFLMTILISIIITVFKQSTEAYKICEERLSIYPDARACFKRIDTDLQKIIRKGDASTFSLFNGNDVTNIDEQTDGIAFTAYVRNETVMSPEAGKDNKYSGTADIEYMLVPEPDPTFFSDSNPDEIGVPRGMTSDRTLYTLRRIVRAREPLSSGPGSALEPFLSGRVINYSDVCYKVVSFNVELLYEDPSGNKIPAFVNLSEETPYKNVTSGFSSTNFINGAYPLTQLSQIKVPSLLRVTLRLVGSAYERQERMFSVVFPVGNN